MTLGGIRDHLGKSGLAGAGRYPQNDGREKFISLDRASQKLAFANNMLLSDIFIEGARTHTRSQRGLILHALLHGVVKEILGHGSDYSRGGYEKLMALTTAKWSNFYSM